MVSAALQRFLMLIDCFGPGASRAGQACETSLAAPPYYRIEPQADQR